MLPLKNRQHDELEEAFARLRESLRSYLRRRLPDSVQAEDLLQGVFLKALATQRSGRRIENLSGWLYAATRNALVDYYRAMPAAAEVLDEEFPAPDDEADEMKMHRELSTCLRPFIERLPTLYRDTLIATELEGETMRALAEDEGVSVSAIKSRASRGRSLLRAALLACCHIEMQGGRVSDYHRKPTPGCDGPCT